MNWRAVADRAIELPVVTSYTSIGPALRRRIDRWKPLDSYRLDGRVVAITGATSGIGLAAAGQLARCGAETLLIARDRGKAERVRREIIATTGNERIEVLVADMADFASIRAVAETILARKPRIDALVHNAGALNRDWHASAQGIERTVASQVAGPFLLTGLLLDRLSHSTPSRVVTMSSGGMYTQPLTVKGLDEPPGRYRGAVAYARAKRAQVTLNELWAERTRGLDVHFHALHPGWVDTPGLRESLPAFRRVLAPLLRSPAQGADTMVWLTADEGKPIATSGRFWLDRRPRPIHLFPRTRHRDTAALRQRLWAWCAEQTGWSM